MVAWLINLPTDQYPRNLVPVLAGSLAARNPSVIVIVDASESLDYLIHAGFHVPAKGGWPSWVVTFLNACRRVVAIKPSSLSVLQRLATSLLPCAHAHRALFTWLLIFHRCRRRKWHSWCPLPHLPIESRGRPTNT